MKQIVITIKEGNILTYLTTDLKRDCVTKNFETQITPRKMIPYQDTKRYQETHAAPSVTIEETCK